MTMIEKMARAMFDVNPGNEIMSWNEPEVREIFTKAARAALGALREPDEATVMAMWQLMPYLGDESFEIDLDAVFRSAVDHILSEKPA